MNDYAKGILTGVSLILCFFMFVSAKSQSKNLGDISVRSISVFNEVGNIGIGLTSTGRGGAIGIFNSSGEVVGTLSVNDSGNNGILITYNADGKQTAYVGSGDDGNGMLTTNNIYGKQTAYVGTSEDGAGSLKTSNAEGKMTAFIGTGESGDGHLQTFADGKKTAYLGTGEGGFGMLQTFNKYEVRTGYFGTNKDQDGIAVLSDRYGDAGWGESGKK